MCRGNRRMDLAAHASSRSLAAHASRHVLAAQASSRSLATLLLLVAALAARPLGAQTPTVVGSDPGLTLLEDEISRLAEIAGGEVGVGAIHLETGREVYLNPGERFPMASVYKVAIAVQLLTRVDQGEVRLDSLVEVRPGDLHPGSGILTDLFDDPGVLLSLRNLMELMLLISDNSATDMVLEGAGGPEAVTARMQALGVDGVRVDRSVLEMLANRRGISELPPEEEMTPARYREIARAVTPEEREAALASFETDPRDTATPEGMARLLAGLWQGELLSPESTALLLDIMYRSETGQSRIKGNLPPWIEVAHKTGSLSGTTNDAGIIELPGEAGHVVAVIFVKESERDGDDREDAIAHIARAIYDYFLFNPGEPMLGRAAERAGSR